MILSGNKKVLHVRRIKVLKKRNEKRLPVIMVKV